MESKKDNIAHTRGHEIKNNALLFGSNSYLGSFVTNESVGVVKKTERLVTALYLVTECMFPDEPMREKARILALDLLSESHRLLEISGMGKFSQEGNFVLALIEIRSIVSLGISVSLVSSMNGTILINEINTLIQDIEADKLARVGEFGGVRNHMRHKELSLTKEMFDIKGGEILDKHTENSSTQTVSFREENVKKESVLYKGHQNIGSQTKGHSEYLNPQIRPLAKAKVHSGDSGSAKSDIAIRLGRRNTILKLIKDKKEVTIKEVSNVVPDVSEKTIQRELLNLVSEGVLKKTGEKRWSRYSLKT
jgi:hypothetical protein